MEKSETREWSRWNAGFIKRIGGRDYVIVRLDGGSPPPWVVVLNRVRVERADGTSECVRLSDAKRLAHEHARKKS